MIFLWQRTEQGKSFFLICKLLYTQINPSQLCQNVSGTFIFFNVVYIIFHQT